MAHKGREVRIRPVRPSELPETFEVLRELRAGLAFGTFVRRLRRQHAIGYRLYVACRDGIVGLVGMRRVETMARGPHLHVDDLVVTERYRGQGIGRTLMSFVEARARRSGLAAVFLDSRPEVLAFYAKLGYSAHTATLVRKQLD